MRKYLFPKVSFISSLFIHFISLSIDSFIDSKVQSNVKQLEKPFCFFMSDLNLDQKYYNIHIFHNRSMNEQRKNCAKEAKN